MYERFYGLRERPFDLTPDPRYLFLTPKHQEALSSLEYGISRRKGVTVVLGPAGTGKTTLIRAALARLNDGHAECVYVSNPTLRRDEFVETLARGFNLSRDAARSKATLLSELEQHLRARLATGSISALIVDEAQALSDELLEEVRLLVNLETETEKLLPVVLVGQAELADRLAQPSCAALKQRIALRCQLMPLTASETAQYIATRLRIAGGNPGQSFTREAIDAIHQRSGGTPRTISVICDNALLAGFAADQRPVGRQLVLDVCRDFDFEALAAGLEVPAIVAPRADAIEPVVTPAEPEVPAPAAPKLIAASEPRPVTSPENRPQFEPRPAPRPNAPATTDEDGNLFATFGRPARSWFSR